MVTTPATKVAARKARLTTLFLFCLTISTVTAHPEPNAEAASFTNQEKGARQILIYEDGNPYNYCEAEHPTVDTYPDPPVKGATLSNVQMFIRHGDRTSQSFYPVDHKVTYECSAQTDYNYFTSAPNGSNASLITTQVVTIPQDSPYAKSIWKGSCIPGQLTPKGAEQQERMGRALRRIYVDKLGFLPEKFQPEKFFVRSTDFWRTRQSATSLINGLYTTPSSSGATPPPALRLTTLPFELEYLVFNERDQCPRVNQLKSIIARKSPLLQHLYTHIPAPIISACKIIDYPNTVSVDEVSDFVSPRVCHDLPMPCVKEGEECVDGMGVMEAMAVFRSKETGEMLRDSEGSFELLKVGFGPAVEMVRRNVIGGNARKEGGEGVVFSLYSGHDTMLMPLLAVLESLDLRWPPYASNILIEQWETPSSEKYIRVIYNNRIVRTKSNWCDLSWCPVQTFLDRLEKYLPGDDYLETCQEQPKRKPKNSILPPYMSDVRK
ncbi:Acid phosphatase-like protein 2 [Linnemannia gamsii]|uniref:Acid phosphatase-like protein 2 n=1 Tax=Linnemannia gamsii TaxID=64522 RepID=A0ABQ7K9G5_9FUNG|nr:Acid phosphatase-like protein 2 [Linnemannia gamsii]